LVTPDSWLVESVTTDGKNVTTSFSQQGNTVRIPMLSPDSKKVNWSVKFKKGNVVQPTIASVTGLKSRADMEEVSLIWDKSDAYVYRITRNGAFLGEVNKESFVDKDIALGANYKYTIQSKSWNGEWTKSVEAAVSVPSKLVLPPAPPKPGVAFNSLTPINIKTDEYAVKGDTIKLNRPRVLTYAIPNGAKRFVASVSVDPTTEVRQQGKVRFSIIGDVLEMGEPPVTITTSPTIVTGPGNLWHFDVELDPRMKQVQLVVEEVLNISRDSGINWINAGITK
jgi:hypothetical protein